jgi:RNA polymerase sigma-70 factor, ECF subfamily
MNSSFAARLAALPLAWNDPGEAVASPTAELLSDEDLLTRLQAGEQEALGFLFERYAKLVWIVAARILRDDTEAEDLVQDLFLFIRRKCAIFDGSKCSARSWIIQMTYHRAIDRRRYLASRQFYSSKQTENDTLAVVGTPTNEIDYSAPAVLGRNGLTKVLRALSKDQRETLRLHFFEGYTLAEISAKLGQPLGNVRHHYYRALDKLRKEMFGTRVGVDHRRGK